jgi:hypothetical protein
MFLITVNNPHLIPIDLIDPIVLKLYRMLIKQEKSNWIKLELTSGLKL